MTAAHNLHLTEHAQPDGTLLYHWHCTVCDSSGTSDVEAEVRAAHPTPTYEGNPVLMVVKGRAA